MSAYYASMDRDLPRLMDSSEVATWLQIPARRIEQLARSGQIPSVEILGELRFQPAALRSWLFARRQPAPQIFALAGGD